MTNRQIGMIVVTLGAAYLVWRIQESQGGPIVLVNPLKALMPGNPSPVASDGSGTTNPLNPNFRDASAPFKRPGNASILPARPARRGTRVDPSGPPSEMTFRTAQPERLPFLGEKKYVPQLGDPNLTAWDYLSSTPPEILAPFSMSPSGRRYTFA